MNFKLPLPNGWMISLAEDVPPALVSVAAWPVADDETRRTRWFEFRPGVYDARCHSAEDMVEAVMAVVRGPAPEPLA